MWAGPWAGAVVFLICAWAAERSGRRHLAGQYVAFAMACLALSIVAFVIGMV